MRVVEDGQADVIAAAYFDRLFRTLAVQAEVSSVSNAPAAACSRSTWACNTGRLQGHCDEAYELQHLVGGDAQTYREHFCARAWLAPPSTDR